MKSLLLVYQWLWPFPLLGQIALVAKDLHLCTSKDIPRLIRSGTAKSSEITFMLCIARQSCDPGSLKQGSSQPERELPEHLRGEKM
jgi:hypothetical protein